MGNTIDFRAWRDGELEAEMETEEYDELRGKLILSKEHLFDMDDRVTGINNNVLIVGTSGSGKTRSIIEPNILQATGSYIVVDPKGNQHAKYATYLKSKGYVVKKLNFAEPSDAASEKYNFFRYIRSDQDIVKIAHMIIKSADDNVATYKVDPFWDHASELLLTSLIGYLYHFVSVDGQSWQNVIKLILLGGGMADEYEGSKTPLDYMFEEIEREEPNHFVVSMYNSFRTAAGRTICGINISLLSQIAIFNTQDIANLLADDTLSIGEIGKVPTALFVVVSDTDRSMDRMANLFFTQCMNELCYTADHLPGNRLPVPVRFFLDDFATNVRIENMPRMISSIRSRGISVTLVIQAESQLTAAYGYDGQTIIGNCDTYVYLGTGDMGTAERIAEKTGASLREVMFMQVGDMWLFRRGAYPVHSTRYQIEEHPEYRNAMRLYEESRAQEEVLQDDAGASSEDSSDTGVADTGSPSSDAPQAGAQCAGRAAEDAPEGAPEDDEEYETIDIDDDWDELDEGGSDEAIPSVASLWLPEDEWLLQDDPESDEPDDGYDEPADGESLDDIHAKAPSSSVHADAGMTAATSGHAAQAPSGDPESGSTAASSRKPASSGKPVAIWHPKSSDNSETSEDSGADGKPDGGTDRPKSRWRSLVRPNT